MDHQGTSSETESTKRANHVSFSGPLVSSNKTKRSSSRTSGRMKNDDNDGSYEVEIILDVKDDEVSMIVGNTTTSEHDLSADSKMINNSLGSMLSSRLKQVSRELTRMASSKRSNSYKLDRSHSVTAHALNGLRFMNKNIGNDGWSEIRKRFNELSVGGVLHKSLFAHCIGMKESSEFADKLFDALARKRCIGSNCITEGELFQFWEQITDASFDTRLETFFDMVDKDADGRIMEDEVKEIITLSAAANNLSKIQEHADEYAALIMEELDPDNRGYIELQNLETLLVQAPHYASNPKTENRVLSQMLSQKLKSTKDFHPIKRWFRKKAYFMEDNWKRIWVMALWLSICGGLFTWKFIQYKHKTVFHVMGYCVSTAKGGAETLKFNMALILLPVCRNTMTWLRSRTKLGSVVPFDDNINFHKVIALGIAVGTALHVGAHLTCDFPRLLHATDAEYEPMKPLFGEERPDNYWWFVKGTEGWTGIIMLVLMAIAFTLAQPWFRRNRINLPTTLKNLTGFNAFWYSHHLFVLVYILFIIHGYFLYITKKWYKKTTWMYLVFPMVLYASERLIRAFRSGHKTVQILKVSVYPGNVMSLHMSKPQGFKYTSGQYIFVNCPEISPFQWHPFSITSAPGDDYLSIHIRTRGDWTSQLKAIFSKVCHTPDNDQSGLLRADIGPSSNKLRLPKLLIDGPYGAPAQDYKKYDIVLLIGLGIGATPLISIVKDVLNNIKQQKDTEKGSPSETANGSYTKSDKKRPFATRRAYFYWVTREQGSFEWFRGVMNEVAENDCDGVIELHNHCTSVYEEGDARSALIAMLQSLEHAKTGLDIVSGTKVKTHFARPDWRRVFKNVAVNHADQRVGVFYCGPPTLVGELRGLAHDFSRKTSTKFDFHKENF